MSLIRSMVPQKTRSVIKEAIGLQGLANRLGGIESSSIPELDRRLAHLEAALRTRADEPESSVVREFDRRLARLETALQSLSNDPRKEFPTAFWYDRNLSEPTVVHALRDWCRPGDVVFDVGANCGALSILMSRLVGPRGVVCSFEASRRIVDKCQYNLAINGCHNTQLFHRAVFRQSAEAIRIYHGSHLNDTVVEEHAGSESFHEVETIALDDFAKHFNLSPKLIKMDIEGAEFDALQGARQTIAENRPVIILEQQPQDVRCLDFLLEQGYEAIDLATYEPVKSPADFPPGVGLANVLFVDRDQLAKSPYRLPLERSLVRTLTREEFHFSANGDVCLQQPIDLPSGRYLCRTEFTAQGVSNEAIAGVEADGEVIFRYHTHSNFLSTSYRDWIVHLPRRQSLNLFVRFLAGTSDPTFDFQGATIFRIDGLSSSNNLSIA